MQRAVLILALAALCSPALAQRSRAQTPPPPTAPATPAAPATPPATPAAPEPQRTTATFADWTLRCVRPEKAPPTCEVGQTLYDKGQPVAQTAIGRTRPGEPMHLTILVPVNVSLTAQPRLVGAENEAGVSPIELGWRRCVPNGCLADTLIGEDQLKRLRGRTENARILFQDSAGREATLPFSPRGLGQALDALAKEG
jgi:invasion protein IalB